MKKLLLSTLIFSVIGLQASAAKKVTAIEISVIADNDFTLGADQADQTISGTIKKGDLLAKIFPIVTDSTTSITAGDLKGQIAEAWGADVKNITLKLGGQALADTVKFDTAYSGRTPLVFTAAVVMPAPAPAVTTPAPAPSK